MDALKVSVSLLATALVAAFPPSSAAQQAQAPAAGHSVDIAGVRLGMSSQQAAAAVRTANPRFQISTNPAVRFDLLPNVAFNEVVYARHAGDAAHGQESIDLKFTQPPNQPLLWSIQRNKQYADAERPTAANLIAALREKYGTEDGSTMPPAVAKASGVELRDAYWIFDAHGQRLPRQRASQLAATCTQIWESSYLDRLKLPRNPAFTNPNAANCFENTAVTAYLTPTTPGVTGPPGLVLALVVKAVNMNLYRAHYEASEKFLSQAAEASGNSQQEKAKQVKPKL